ncbi:MAG: hypothetical protein ACTMUB_00595 [cyanobacterium endosymbiont of Rhopalodia musculus]|nr:hypothetical protein [cyanobacterium endosymbiont of Epithemia clementina EcSB]WGT66775.1 hypothetical protein P3F56_05820 [cyanobacterium endosymbiont of Epithemia clementina EcSB]
MLRPVGLRRSLSAQLVAIADLMSANYWGLKAVLNQRLFIQGFI